MSYSIKQADDSDYILIEVHGVINRAIGMQLTIESHQLGSVLGIDKYFMDLTDAVNDDATLDQYHFANTDMLGAEGVNRYAKVAGLVDPEDHSHDFIETVIRNIGLNFRLFRDRRQAMAFLGYDGASMKRRG